MKRNRLTDDDLLKAVKQIEQGLVDANLGGGLLKQRIARPNQGKSSGFRTILIFRASDRTIFVYGFAKNDRDNIRADELQALKDLATELLVLQRDFERILSFRAEERSKKSHRPSARDVSAPLDMTKSRCSIRL